ncbi:hypothetical protein HX049_17220 [Myroides odoratimimus]|uniref:DUF6707 family protein n=1 Tax=Myroides odoratimimus TaxID=76832 RepID=UPI002576DE2A|nr:DUF6707 family protein [Myroides odoratimimus]MDM1398885.1 hypothetical protein [Myroides odoratimimus]
MDLDQMYEAYGNIRQIKTCINRARKGVNFNSTVSLSNLSDLAYWLYIVPNDLKMSLSVCDQIKEIAFAHNFNKWVWIENLSQLGAFINEQLDNKEEREFYVQKVKSPLLAIDEDRVEGYLRTKQRVVNGSLLYHKEISRAVKDKDIKGEIEWRKGQVEKLINIYITGGSEVFTNEELLKEITLNIDEIRRKL